jgi:hypothetical protein
LGGTLVNTTTDYGDTFGSGNIDQVLIGALRTVTETGHFDGRIREIIVYNSDQSDNRTAIEANIGETYGITDIPAADDTVNGFVQTWYDQSGDNRTAIEANIGETYGITDIPAADDTVNGFVQTWYDQSGEGNDAVQSAAANQPKIVGEVTSGQPHAFLGALVFDQANETELVVVGDPVITADYTGTYSAFSIQTVSNSEFGYLYGNAALGSGSSLYNNGNVYAATNKSTASGFDKISKTSDKDLLSAVYNNGDAGLLVNGGGTMTNQGTYDFASGTANFRIGNRAGGTSGGTYLTGSIEEIIVYNSDQSSNRPAIEANIANQYGITLS